MIPCQADEKKKKNNCKQEINVLLKYKNYFINYIYIHILRCILKVTLLTEIFSVFILLLEKSFDCE